MCGIVGMALKANNGLTKNTEDFFYEALFVDTLRGEDSTGIIYIENDASFGIMKEANSATWCADAMKNSTELRGMWSRGKALIGHNRKKTVGDVSDETAHPFVVDGKFAMVHNGTLYNHKLLANTVVDSEALTIHLSKVLNKDYTKEKLEEALGKVNGAYAIAAFNQDTNKVYLTRNKERPLHIIETNTGWFWASEGLMLYWILHRNNIYWGDNKVTAVKENSLVTIDLETNTLTVEDYVPKKATPVMPVHTKTTAFHGNNTTPTQATSLTTTTTTKNPKLSKNEFKRIKRRYLGVEVPFFCSDWLENNFPRSVAEGEVDVVLLGECEQFLFDHTIQAEFDINDCVPGTVDLTEHVYRGKIVEMQFDQARGTVSLFLSKVVMIPPSRKTFTNETTTTSPYALH